MSDKVQQNTPLNESIFKKNEIEEKEIIETKDKKIEDDFNYLQILDLRNKRILELEKELIKITQKERDNILRTKAEIENIRKRSEQNIEKAHKFALENFISELLPVIDNLERTLYMSDKNNMLSSIIEGINLTLKALITVIIKFGINIIEDSNVPFNPNIHQAMSLIESNEYEPNQVIKIMQKGYTLNGRLIRPAMVIVSKKKI